jgi:hypothetical protein
MKLIAYMALIAGANARFSISKMQVANNELVGKYQRVEKANQPAPRNFDAPVNPAFEDDRTEVVLMRIPPANSFI